MSPWLLATIAVLPALAFPLVACWRGPVPHRLIALQLATSIATISLVLMTFPFGQASSIDLPLTLGLLGLPATLLFAVFLERWL